MNYFGHIIDKYGISPNPDKVRANVDAPQLKDISQLWSFLGMLNHHHRFLPMLSTELKPLYDILLHGRTYEWTNECSQSFNKGKERMMNQTILTHFDSGKDISIWCLMRAHSKLEKEPMVIIFGIKRFHKYIYGRKFTLVTISNDIASFKKHSNTNCGLNSTLGFDIRSIWLFYLISKSKANLDCLSRLPTENHTNLADRITSFSKRPELPLSCEKIAAASAKDIVLCKAISLTKNGWPSNVNNDDFALFLNEDLSCR